MELENLKVEIRLMKRKTLALQITHEGNILVKAPKNISKQYIIDFVQSKSTWIQKKLVNIHQSQNSVELLNLQHLDIPKQKKLAKTLIKQKMSLWSEEMTLVYKSIRLSSARTRWGSCTHQNTISINWRLSLLPEKLLDYVIIHELAHIKEKNHSSKFWDIVVKYCPDYKQIRNELKNFGQLLRSI